MPSAALFMRPTCETLDATKTTRISNIDNAQKRRKEEITNCAPKTQHHSNRHGEQLVNTIDDLALEVLREGLLLSSMLPDLPNDV